MGLHSKSNKQVRKQKYLDQFSKTRANKERRARKREERRNKN